MSGIPVWTTLRPSPASSPTWRREVCKAGLGPCGDTSTQDRINPETQFADIVHVPAPGRDVERERIGLLGWLASSPCIIEVYSRAPSARRVSRMHAQAPRVLAAARPHGEPRARVRAVSVDHRCRCAETLLTALHFDEPTGGRPASIGSATICWVRSRGRERAPPRTSDATGSADGWRAPF